MIHAYSTELWIVLAIAFLSMVLPLHALSSTKENIWQTLLYFSIVAVKAGFAQSFDQKIFLKVSYIYIAIL